MPLFRGEADADDPLFAAQRNQIIDIDVGPAENQGLGQAIVQLDFVERKAAFKFFETIGRVVGGIHRIGVKAAVCGVVILPERPPVILAHWPVNIPPHTAVISGICLH